MTRSMPRRPLPRSYAHVPRTILWLVPGGEFVLNGRTVEVEPFYLGKWPVTNEQFEAFDPGHERSPLAPRDRDLAPGISWQRADAYCRWYADVSRKPMRLPTEVEWLYACLGRDGPDDRPHWGAVPELVERRCWHAGNSNGRIRAPERLENNGFGLHGMLGSLREWVAPGTDDDDRRTLCGGSFRTLAGELHPVPVASKPPGFAADDTGFRVARSFRTSHVRGRDTRQS